MRLLDEGMSQRKIARVTGISRGTIGRIHSGERGETCPARLSRRQPDEYVPNGEIEKCPTCGHRVVHPCLACIVRNRLEGKEPRQAAEDEATEGSLILGLELLPEMLRDYAAMQKLAKRRHEIAGRQGKNWHRPAVSLLSRGRRR